MFLFIINNLNVSWRVCGSVKNGMAKMPYIFVFITGRFLARLILVRDFQLHCSTNI